MKNLEYAIATLEYLYEEGDIDLIFFGQILDSVSYDKEDHLFDKTPEQRMTDAIRLVEYLTASGDFFIGETMKQENGSYIQYPYKNGFQEFFSTANDIFSKNGIADNTLKVGIWLKKARAGLPAPKIPAGIAELFE